MAKVMNLKGFTPKECLYLIDSTGYPLPGNIEPCLMCGKAYLCRAFVGVPDPVCPDCYETYKDCASILCAKCKIVIAKTVPKVMENGFYVRPNAVLHSNQCNICAPGLVESTVIELEAYENSLGRPKKIIVPMVLPTGD